ncbi:MAG: adenylate/guanylate cyclase domain-containing protein [Desulfobacterales bacterium]|nr:MAG: adenylate/guanylate cyclase domain-containing protein [Desulfobacterales bacterium]
MARLNDILAILFADIAKSTHIYETLGNKVAKNLIDASLSLLSNVTAKHQGTVIKTIGDEIMCTFPTANDAVEAAVEMHQSLEDMPFPEKPEYGSPNIYVGIQFGPVIKEGGDVFGDAVNVAARMVALAKQRQIITTEGTVKLLSKERQALTRCIDKTTVKGKSGILRIYEVIWEEHDVTVMATHVTETPTQKSRLELTYKGQTIKLDENRPIATLGRQPHNDVVVDDKRVSRSHARIEYNRGKFMLIDQSSNGTMLRIQGKKSMLLKREETQLLGTGVIGLGRKVTPDSETAVHFAVRS